METAPSSKSIWLSFRAPAVLPAVHIEGRRGRTNYLLCLCSVALVSSLPASAAPALTLGSSNTCLAPSLKSVSLVPRAETLFSLPTLLALHHCSAFLSNKLQYLITLSVAIAKCPQLYGIYWLFMGQLTAHSLPRGSGDTDLWAPAEIRYLPFKAGREQPNSPLCPSANTQEFWCIFNFLLVQQGKNR